MLLSRLVGWFGGVEMVAAAWPEGHDIADGMTVPTAVQALLAPYLRPNPAPGELIGRPGQPFAGHRVLGGWWAAQLFDSSLIRGLSCLDRLAIMLHCAAGKDLTRDRRTQELRLPAFRANYLEPLAVAYDPPCGTS
jgi:hypothetical protein